MAKKLFTYSVTCVFQMQFTFGESQVGSGEEAGDDPEPTSEAVAELENELREHIGHDYAVDRLVIEDEAFVFLGTSEEDD